MFRGAITALITPFKNGALDEAALQSLVDWQITEGIDGLVPVGTTGESPTLSHAEHERVVEVVVEAAASACRLLPVPVPIQQPRRLPLRNMPRRRG